MPSLGDGSFSPFSRNFLVVRDANTRHAQLALSDDLAGRHGALGASPGAYRASVCALFASHLRDPLSAPLIADDPFTGVPVALAPANEARTAATSWRPSWRGRAQAPVMTPPAKP